MAAPEPSQLVEMFLPLALGQARWWTTAYPYLADDFRSDALLTLWKAAVAFKPTSTEHVGAFVEFLRRRIRWAFLNLVKVARRNRRRVIDHIVSEAGEVSLLDTVADDAPEVGAELEMAEELKCLFERADLTEAEREAIVHVVAQDLPTKTIAARRRVSRNRVYQLVTSARKKLLVAAG
jgi:RNA polymerase sigma factor (sigma-70 family)